MPSTPPELADVERAADDVRRARLAYRRAIVKAHSVGLTGASIARAAGTSRQAVASLIERSKRPR